MPAALTLVEPVFETPPAEVRLAVERQMDAAEVDALVERAFGPGRYAKVSERLREGNLLNRSLSFCAFGGGTMVGSVRQWPLLVGEAKGVFLGPIAVEAAWRKHGVGGRLITRCCEVAAEAGEAFILLVGDFSLFNPYGFERVSTGQVILPGPVNPARVLVRALRPDGLEGLSGSARVPRP